MERQIYMPTALFRRQEAPRFHGVNVIDHFLRDIQAGTAANRPFQGIVNGPGAGQVSLPRRPFDILAPMAVTHADIHSCVSAADPKLNMALLRMIVNIRAA